MIDPWKFNPLTKLGNRAGKISEIQYVRESLAIVPVIISETIKTREAVRNGSKTLINNSNELFL